jgi:hypothetical protein
MILRRPLVLSLPLVAVLAGCGNKNTDAASSSTAAASTSSASQSAATATATAKDSAAASGEKGSIASLREKATGVMDALKKGDSKAAGDFCLGKHHDALIKFIDETIHEGGGRPKAYQAWDGKLGEIRTDGKMARVQIGEEEQGPRVVYLSFRDKDGTWSLDDIPVLLKSEWSKWGQVAN